MMGRDLVAVISGVASHLGATVSPNEFGGYQDVSYHRVEQLGAGSAGREIEHCIQGIQAKVNVVYAARRRAGTLVLGVAILVAALQSSPVQAFASEHMRREVSDLGGDVV